LGMFAGFITGLGGEEGMGKMTVGCSPETGLNRRPVGRSLGSDWLMRMRKCWEIILGNQGDRSFRKVLTYPLGGGLRSEAEDVYVGCAFVGHSFHVSLDTSAIHGHCWTFMANTTPPPQINK
jgi:hypothetical protein